MNCYKLPCAKLQTNFKEKKDVFLKRHNFLNVMICINIRKVDLFLVKLGDAQVEKLNLLIIHGIPQLAPSFLGAVTYLV